MKEERGATSGPQILSGWKEIAIYLGKGVRTVQRYERLHGLPVRRPAGKPSGSVVATKAEIDGWVDASPVREALWLSRPATRSAYATWSDLKSNAEEMKKLAKQMEDLRMELKSSVRLLRMSIREVQGGLNGSEWERRSEPRVAGIRSLFTTIYPDTTNRKVS
jgi:hypothetical protein